MTAQQPASGVHLRAPLTPLREIMAEWQNLGNECPGGVPIRRLNDIRHKLTANIKFNLYGDGDRNEGRDALSARYKLDDFLFKAEQTPSVEKRAIILDTFLELLEILDQARDTGGSRRGIKAEMQKLVDDPDRFDRFHDRDKAAIREMARGLAIFVKIRFNHLHESLRRQAGQFMG
jgi:hypothetical protein